MLTLWDKTYILFVVWYFWAMITWIRANWFMLCPPNPPGKIRAKWFIAGFDMWFGVFIDHKTKTAYWFPLPFVGRKYWREQSKEQA
jgi:hypothetical protein